MYFSSQSQTLYLIQLCLLFHSRDLTDENLAVLFPINWTSKQRVIACFEPHSKMLFIHINAANVWISSFRPKNDRTRTRCCTFDCFSARGYLILEHNSLIFLCYCRSALWSKDIHTSLYFSSSCEATYIAAVGLLSYSSVLVCAEKLVYLNTYHYNLRWTMSSSFD